MVPEDKVDLCLMDPIRMFVKNEPHKKAKRVTKRVRLIQSVSVVDNMLLSLVCSDQNNREIANWFKLPSCPGIGFTKDQVGQFLTHLPAGPYSHSDMSGWDFSVQEFEVDLDFQFRALLEYGGEVHCTAFVAALHAQMENSKQSLYQLGDGFLVAQEDYGITNTGAKDTASGNSRRRSFVHRICGGKWNRAVGDDCVGDPIDQYEEKCAKLGHILRDQMVTDAGFRLCSSWWDVKTGMLQHDLAKALFNYLTGPRRDDMREQFLELVENSPLESQVRALVAGEWQGPSNDYTQECEETDPEGASSPF